MATGRKNIQRNNLIQLALGLAIIILLNIAGSFLYTRFDLTTEKRYTLSDATRNMLMEVDDIVYFQVYLEGEFPAGFTRLRNATKEMLDEFRAYNKNIHYEFINPSASDDDEERTHTYQLLVEKGLQPTDLQVNTKEGREQQIIFPGAIVLYKSKELAVELLKSQIGVQSEQVLNNSIQNLEFSLASAIRNLTKPRSPRVAFIGGHKELGDNYIFDAAQTLSDAYVVERVYLDEKINALTRRDSIADGGTSITNNFDAIIIAKPDSAFSEKDKFIIDQYIMRGGNVLWLIDPVMASMDSLTESGSTMGLARNLNLDDMLFNYGVRLNGDLIMDLNSLPIPLVTGHVGNQPQIDFFNWFFFPVLTPMEEHSIVRNLNVIKTEFISTLDTIMVPGVEKTILLHSSPYSRVMSSPVIISLNILQEEPDERLYTGPPQAVAVLLEGKFESNFVNRVPVEIATDPEIGFVARSAPAKMIVVADGDVIKNQIDNARNGPLPLGYDQYTGETFGNKEFILNAVNYLTDDSGLIEIRKKDLKLRLLDMTRVNASRTLWQIVNMVVPVVLLILFGLSLHIVRKRRYSR